jgi:hypothetical protein
MDEGKYQVDNMGPVQGQIIGDHVQVTQHFYGPGNIPPSQQRAPAPVSTDRNRQRMLERVRLTWIVGVLDHSLYDAARIALGLHEEPGALANPWRLVVQEIDRPAQPLPAGTCITEVYDEAGGALLILGEPGAGKTTLLLELARDLLARAHADEREPIPVVFNLSSWAQQRAPLADWLVEELSLRYQASRTLGQSWVDNDKLLLLLDGLDEVAAAQRGACIQAINSYRQAHPLVSMVVCSRNEDYLNQKQQLELQRAIVVQPLTAQQIDEYLARAGEQVAAVRVALNEDKVLQELATTPLMLNILILAYRGVPLDEITRGGSAEARQEQLLASYVQHMLKRRRAETRYTPEQTTHWLSHLASQMKRQNQTLFYLEQMQPDWLSSSRALRVYKRLAVRLPGVLIGMIVSFSISVFIPFSSGGSGENGIINILLGGLLGGFLSEGRTPKQPTAHGGKARSAHGSRLFQWLLIGALIILGSRLSYLLGFWAVLLFPWLILGLCSILFHLLLERNNTAEAMSESTPLAKGTIWRRLTRRRAVHNGVLVGLSVGLSVGLIYWLGDGIGPSLGLIYWLRDGGWQSGLLVGLGDGESVGLNAGLSAAFLSILLTGRSTGIQPTDLLVWSWKSLSKGLFSKSHVSTTVRGTALIASVVLSVGLIYGLVSLLIYGPVDFLIFNSAYELLGLLIFVLFIVLIYWLLLGLFQGVSSVTIEDQHRIVPNRGIRRSALNGLVLGLISAVIVGLLGALSLGLYFGLSYGLNYGLRVGLGFGLSAGLLAGLIVGLLAGLLKGGLAYLRHYVLRFLLWRIGSVPWRYVPFLDYAAERILLRKVGGGYIFIHHLLLDYFASLAPSAPVDIMGGGES